MRRFAAYFCSLAYLQLWEQFHARFFESRICGWLTGSLTVVNSQPTFTSDLALDAVSRPLFGSVFGQLWILTRPQIADGQHEVLWLYACEQLKTAPPANLIVGFGHVARNNRVSGPNGRRAFY